MTANGTPADRRFVKPIARPQEAAMPTPFEFAQAEHQRASRDWRGWCLVFVRSCFGVTALYPSAASAWFNARYKHPTTSGASIPRGVPVFWTGGSGGFGHIALSRGDGTCWTTDFKRPGQVDVARIDDIGPGWGLTLVGWTEDVNGVRVYEQPTTPAVKDPDPVEMRTTYGPRADAVLDAARQLRRGNKPHSRRRRVANQVMGLIRSLRSRQVPK